jgi:hypothetical protein
MTDRNPPLWALSTADPDVCGEWAGMVAPAPRSRAETADEGREGTPLPLPEPL